MDTVPTIPTQDVYFDDAATKAMGIAFDSACNSLRNVIGAFTVRARIAKQIIEAAKMGERNPRRLQEGAIKALGLEQCLYARGSGDQSWTRLFEQNLRVDKWSVHRG